MANTFEVLKRIITLFSNNTIFFVIGGNTGLLLQNIEIEDDHEIDICTDKTGAYKIQELLNNHCTEPISYKESSWFKAHRGTFENRWHNCLSDGKSKTEA